MMDFGGYTIQSITIFYGDGFLEDESYLPASLQVLLMPFISIFTKLNG